MNQMNSPIFSDMTNAVEIIAGPECASLQNFLDAFCDAGETSFGCLMVYRKIAVATRRWWSLSATELVLLSMLATSAIASSSSSFSSSPKCISQDIPIFLPDESPTVPYRLLIFELMTNVQVCLLCGSSPSLMKLESEIGRFWKPAFESLKSLSQIYPRNFPLSTVIDQNVLGFILVNNETHRCLSTMFPKQDDGQNKGNLPQKERFEILRSFYKHTIGTYFASTIEASDREPSKLSHTPVETYITSDTHKCYALQSGPNHFFVLYNANIPTFAMRNVTHKMLASLLKDKFIQL